MASPSSKRVLITGLSGFTGRHLAGHLTEQGYSVFGLNSDLRDKDAVFGEIKIAEPDYVVHLAAISFAAESNVDKIYSVNVLGTLNLLDALINAGRTVRRVVLASSATVYGDQSSSVLMEGACPAPVNHYGCSKLVMEHLSRPYADKLDILITRPFNYTGVGHAEHFLIPKIISAYRSGKTAIELGNLHVAREFNDVRDVCVVYERLLKLNVVPTEYVVNVCSGRAVKLLDIIGMMNVIAGYEMGVSVNPLFVRGNEIGILKGSVERLEHLVSYDFKYSIQDTLKWMYVS